MKLIGYGLPSEPTNKTKATDARLFVAKNSHTASGTTRVQNFIVTLPDFKLSGEDKTLNTINDLNKNTNRIQLLYIDGFKKQTYK